MVRTSAALQADFFFCPYRHSCLPAFLGAALVEPQRADEGLRGRDSISNQRQIAGRFSLNGVQSRKNSRAVFVVASATAGTGFPRQSATACRT